MTITYVTGSRRVEFDQSDYECDFCGKNREVRPYGPKGENICFECAMKDEKTTEKMFDRVVFGDK